jgi:hypothetical protein
MSLKTTVMVALGVVLVVAADGPMLASPCPTLIKQANEKLTGMDPQSEQVQTAKALVAGADRLHKAGDHYASLATVRAALAGVK